MTIITNKILALCIALTFFVQFFATAQSICNPAGNLIIYSNYDGGNITISIDEDIPNIKLGLCSYEDLHVTITGAYAENVTEVLYAGYNSGLTTSVSGVDAGIVSILNYPPVTLFDVDGYGYMICAYDCDTNYIPGGCNTVDQATDYFLTELGGSIRYSYFQYGAWSGTYSISDGGNCCFDAACSIPVNAGQDIAICYGDSAQLLGTGAINYSWFPALHLDNAFIENPYANPSVTTTYYLTGTDELGCIGIDTVIVFVNPLPTPTITVSGATLTATGGVAYQWLLNGEIIPGATESTYIAVENGNYSVIVVSNQGCTQTSNALEILVNDLPIHDMPNTITIFPNPANAMLTIDFAKYNTAADVVVINNLGQKISSYKVQPNTTLEIETANLPNGIYQIQIMNNNLNAVSTCVIKH